MRLARVAAIDVEPIAVEGRAKAGDADGQIGKLRCSSASRIAGVFPACGFRGR